MATSHAVPALALNSGASMPALGFGTWGIPPAQVGQAVREAVSVGYRLFDLAPVYFNQPEVGETLASLVEEGVVARKDLWLTSKVPPQACGRHAVKASLHRTLRELRTPYVDLFLVHWPFCVRDGSPSWPPPLAYRMGYSAAQLRETWRAMEELQRSGLARAVGLSNIGPRRLDTLLASADLRVTPAVVQVEMHPYLQNRELRRLCEARGIRVTAYCSLGSAARPAKYQHAADPRLLNEPALVRVGREAAAPPAAVALAWALARGVAVIPKSVRPERIAANYGAAALRLSAAQLGALDALDRGHRFLADGWLQHAWVPAQRLEWIVDDPEPGSVGHAWMQAHAQLAAGAAERRAEAGRPAAGLVALLVVATIAAGRLCAQRRRGVASDYLAVR